MPQSPITDFPYWVVRKIGQPILLETDFAAIPNAKFGLFATSTGTISQETSLLRYGGAGSCKMLTAATSNDSTEIKASFQDVYPKGSLIAFEQKWGEQFSSGGSNFHVGIEDRNATTIRHVRFRWTNATSKWMYEANDLSYQDFPASVGGPLNVQRTSLSATSGSKPGWTRCVIDPTQNLYVGFEATSAGPTGIETRDMRSMNLPCTNEGAATAWELLFFTLVTAGAAAAEPGYTTDWCVTIIPPDEDPFGASQ